METRANYVIVGIFTIAAILAAFGFVYWTAGVGDRGETAMLRFRIPGSASGLMRGSVVLFNGIKVGDVTRVYIDVSNPSVAIADARVDRLTPITRSTEADVGLAGLTTGQANIELRGGDPSEPNLLELAEAEGEIPVMTANPSAVSNLLESAQNIFRRTDAVLAELEGFAQDARGPLTATLENVEQFSEALGRNAEGIDRFLTSVTAMSETLTAVSGKLDSALGAADELIRAVDQDKVAATIDNIEQFTRSMQEASAGLGEVMAGVNASVAQVSRFSASANETLARVDAIVADVGSAVSNVGEIVENVDPATVRTALTNFEQASANINQAANDVALVSETVSARSTDIDKIITDAQQIAARLAQASERVDTVLAQVDDLLGSGEAEGLMSDASQTLQTFREVALSLNERIGTVLARVDTLLDSGDVEQTLVDARQTLASLREVAETLDARMGPILENLGRFSGQGLQEVESLISETRRSISRIERAITDLESNPQRILTGGDGAVREYDGRARR
jgi:phospholipid/cholesterol/gamma-HCH transport system substrate-binding protein